MGTDDNNIIVQKSKAYAIRIVNLYQYITKEKHEFVLSKQLLRSGTSVGANIHEAIRGQSKADFIAKMNIALKEICETEYWLELMHETGYISKSEFESMNIDNKEIIRLLTSIVKSSRKDQSNV